MWHGTSPQLDHEVVGRSLLRFVLWCQDDGRGNIFASSVAIGERNKTCFKWYFIRNNPAVAKDFWVISRNQLMSASPLY